MNTLSKLVVLCRNTMEKQVLKIIPTYIFFSCPKCKKTVYLPIKKVDGTIQYWCTDCSVDSDKVYMIQGTLVKLKEIPDGADIR